MNDKKANVVEALRLLMAMVVVPMKARHGFRIGRGEAWAMVMHRLPEIREWHALEALMREADLVTVQGQELVLTGVGHAFAERIVAEFDEATA